MLQAEHLRCVVQLFLLEYSHKNHPGEMHPSGVWMEQSKLSECVCEATSHGDEYGVQQVGQVGTPNPKDIHILLSLFQPLHVLHHHHLKEAMNSILEDTNTSNWTTDASLPNEKQDHTLSSPNAQFHDADTGWPSKANVSCTCLSFIHEDVICWEYFKASCGDLQCLICRVYQFHRGRVMQANNLQLS